MLWADVAWHARWGGLDGFAKLLVIPLLMAQFRRSDGGHRVFIGFLIACVALLIASWIVTIWPNIPKASRYSGRSGQRLYCAECRVHHLRGGAARSRRRENAHARVDCFGGSGRFSLAFLGDIFFIVTGRTALVIIPVLAVLYGIRHSGWKGIFGAVAALLAVAAIVWSVSPYLRERVRGVYTETELYELQNKDTSSGERIQFWKRSVALRSKTRRSLGMGPVRSPTNSGVPRKGNPARMVPLHNFNKSP